MDSSLDFLSSIVDEIALEGLDGITLPTLWVRLQSRPQFPLALDDRSKSFIWECIAVHKDIELYQLHSPRPVLELYDRYQHLDPEFGLVTEPAELPEDIYPVKIVEQGDVRGSCQTFDTRICVTSEVRRGPVLLLSLSDAMKKWPDSVVLVASPRLRLLALLGTEVNPLMEMTKEQYCLLERIGRARYQGEVSQGGNGLLLRCLPLKAHLHYYVSKLLQKGLVTKQKHVLRTKSGKTVQGSLFHLTRFYVQRKVKFDTLLECMNNLLKDKPNNRAEYGELRDELGLPLSTFRKLLKRFATKWFKIFLVPLKELNPEASAEEYVLKNGQLKMVKVIQMIHPYIEDEASFIDEEDEESNENPYFDPSKVYLDMPLICQAYKVVLAAGPNGVTLKEMRKALTLPKLDVRALCRNLVRSKTVISVMQDKGRQRFEKYISKQFENESTSCISIKEQSEKFNYEHAMENGVCSKSSAPAGEKPSTDSKTVVTRDQSKIAKSSDFQNIQSEVIEVSDGTKLTNRSSARVKGICREVGDKYQSSRILKRMNIIIAHIKSARLTTVSELCKIISETEIAEGYNFKVDKKSVLRLIQRLCHDRLAKVFKTVLKLNDTTRELEFICHPSLEPSNSEFRTAIEKAKFKYFCTVHKKGEGAKHSPNEKGSGVAKKSKEITDKENIPVKPLADRQIYGLQPKFTRTKALHIFLCYLVHFYEGDETEEQPGMHVYHDSMSWKRFIPPLPAGERKGWCVLSDAISRMPLSIFVKIINLRYEIPELENTLQDPIKQHYLIKYLPQEVRSSLLCNRRYIFLTYEILQRLCLMGLASLGPKLRFEKDQVCVYIHQKARIKDTTIAPPGYLQIDPNVLYETKEYCFNFLSDVENYWMDLETVCCHTPLGRYSVAAGQKIVILDSSEKPELMNAAKNNEYEDVVEGGEIPGDGLGAAGLDSSLFAHCRRNWYWPSFSCKFPVPQNKSDSGKKGNSTLQNLLKKGSKKSEHPESRMRLQRLTKQVLVSSRKRPHPSPSPKRVAKKAKITEKKEKKKVRTVNRKPMRQRKPFYDEKDKAAMKFMNTMKVSWTSQEDSLLLLCKVASMFLDPTFRRLVVPFTVVRDILHETFPNLSRNKTSRACQRRIRHMLVHSEETRYSVDVFLGEARQDAELVKEFDIAKPVKTKEEEWRRMFTSLLSKLIKKFASSNRQPTVIDLPRSVELLKSEYIIKYPVYQADENSYNEPESEYNICFSTITTFILSSLSSSDEEYKFPFILYKVYEQYPEKLLKDAIDKLYRRHLITKKLRYREKKMKNVIQPSSIPYRFTLLYQNYLHLKYPTKIFEETTDFVSRFDDTGNLLFDSETPAGFIVSAALLIFCDAIKMKVEIPNQIIVFDAQFDEKCRSAMLKTLMPSLNDAESREIVDILTAGNTSPNSKDSGEPKAKRPKHDTLQSSSTLPEGSEVEPEGTCTNRDVSQINSSSRLAFYMLDRSFQKPMPDSNPSPVDYISLNPCTLNCSLASENALFEESLDAAISDIISAQASYVNPELFNHTNYEDLCKATYVNLKVSDMVLSEGLGIFKAICSCETLGLPLSEICLKYNHLKGEMSVFQHLFVLLDASLILRVGIKSFCYVGIMHAKPWLVSSFIIAKDSEEMKESDADGMENKEPSASSDARSSGKDENREMFADSLSAERLVHLPLEPVHFLPRTWRKPDGTLNVKVFIHMVRSLLCCIMSSPGITEEKICEKFCFVLQPAQTLELLEVLEKLCCIYKYCSRPLKKSTLFSSCKTAEIVRDTPQPGDTVYYEPYPEAVVRMTRLSSAVLSCEKQLDLDNKNDNFL